MTSKSPDRLNIGPELQHAILNYQVWMGENGYSDSVCIQYKQILKHFFAFIIRNAIAWNDIFTHDTLKEFEKQSGLYHAKKPVRGLSRFLHQKGIIAAPIMPKTEKLPDIYEAFLEFYQRTRKVNHSQRLRMRNTLSAFHHYLENQKIKLPKIKINQIDNFLKLRNANFTPATRQNQRSNLRFFLTYLYRERRLIQRDLASYIVGAPVFAQSKPPKFLRENEIKKLFEDIDISTDKDIRTFAMLHLGYFLGLRPKETALITLDDISFKLGEINIPHRKMANPIKLPLPEMTIKAIAVYIIGVRPKTDIRALFLTLRAPYIPVTPGNVSQNIALFMKKRNIQASTYWLRHTYAQNLLERQSSIYEIKEMLGHDQIQSTQNYLHIQPQLMRKVLFDEIL